MPRSRNNKKKGVPPAAAEFDHQQLSQLHPHEQQQLHNNTRTSSQILARIAELRPVLPRPSQDGGFNNNHHGGGPVHLPSTGISHAHASRHHPENVFNPYERPYGMTHQQQQQHPGDFTQSYLVPGGGGGPPSNPTFGFNDQSYNGQMMASSNNNNPWSSHQEDSNNNNFSTSLSHSNIPPPPDTALSIYDSQPDAIDDWLSQMLSSSTTSSEPFSNYPSSNNGGSSAHFNNQPPQSWGGGGSTSRSFSYSDQQSNPRVQSQSPPFSYGRSPPPPHNMGRPSVIDPRLLPGGGGNMTTTAASYFGPPRSRSPSSSSSQSSHQSSQDNNVNVVVPIYRPSERVQGIYSSGRGGTGGSPPQQQVNIRHAGTRRPPTTDGSGSAGLAGLHIY